MILKILMLAAVVAALFYMVMQPRRARGGYHGAAAPGAARRCSSPCAWPPRCRSRARWSRRSCGWAASPAA
ncbi:hypothetical protein WJ966_04445 [Achromobacter xylosoxidans]